MDAEKVQALIDEAVQKAMADHAEPLDNIWMLLSAMLVFFMHLGFAYLETGTVRAKNAQAILLKNLIVVTVGFLMWYFLGYGLAFGNTAGKLLGTDSFLTTGFEGPSYRIWLFQGAFCATAATIVSGAMAERTQLTGFMAYTILMTALIYPVIIHVGWSGAGFLAYTNDDGEFVSTVGPAYKDFAGSGLVHLVGGVGALIGAIAVGPRTGRVEKPEEFAPHSVPMIVLGTLVLWMGWYGFNGGSTLAMSSAATAYQSALVCVNTTLGAATGGLTVFLLKWKQTQKHDVAAFCNGILAGLVAVTAPCGFVDSGEAMVIGIIGGLVYLGVSNLLVKLHIDDPLDAIPVHGGCGIWGTLATGLFGGEATGGNGLFYGGDQLGVQVVALLFIISWVAAFSVPTMFLLKRLNLLRASEEKELVGGDKVMHSPAVAYSLEEIKAPANVVP
jgi:Amt family ammonium transporter